MAPLLFLRILSGMPDSILLLFSASAMTDTGSKSFECVLECVLVSTLETYDDPENGNYYITYMNYMCYTD